jgi:hypothetical protein
MRSRILIVGGIIYLAVLIFFCHSCNLSECLGVACKHGVCIHGNCNCNSGYQGKTCDTITRNTFCGNFTVTSSCFATQTYPTQINVVSNSNYTQVIVKNVGSLGIIVTANVNDSVSLSIPSQSVTKSGQTWLISGSATMVPGHRVINFQMSYVNQNNNVTQNCTETYNRN